MKAKVFAVVSLLATSVFASFQWDTSVYEGYINTDTSWKGGVAPGSGDSIVSTHSSGDYLIRFPEADYVPGFKEVQFLLTGKASITSAGLRRGFSTGTAIASIRRTDDGCRPRAISTGRTSGTGC